MAASADIFGADSSFDGPMISLRDLRVSYTGREILHGINFDVQRGETLVILGGSRSRKSTLLPTPGGVEKTTSRAGWVRGQKFSSLSVDELDEIRKRLG